MGRLENKIAVITGATSGIGEAVALMYVKEGAKVVLVGRNADKGKQLVEEIQASGGEASFVKCDLRVYDDIVKLKAAVDAKYDHVDILFNSAG
ncbi:MAG: hypothetical protein PWP20_1662, partial [Eubacteriaceae bacterium]|nr:hypothetical protein [Eubacteriaceae bacterium]